MQRFCRCRLNNRAHSSSYGCGSLPGDGLLSTIKVSVSVRDLLAEVSVN